MSGINPMIVISVLFGLGVAMLLLVVYVYPPLYDLSAGFNWTISSGVLIFLLAIQGWIMRKRDRLALMLVLSCFFLIPTALALAVGGVLMLNGLLDRSEATHHKAIILETPIPGNGTGPPNYRMIPVKSWNTGKPDPWIEVDAHFYETAKAGKSTVDVMTKQGRFGIEWIAGIHGADAAEERTGSTTHPRGKNPADSLHETHITGKSLK